MLFGHKINYFNELEINGQPTRDEDDEEYTSTPQDDDIDDESPVEDEDAIEDEDIDNDLEDFTEDEFVDDTETSEETPDDNTTTVDEEPVDDTEDDDADETSEEPVDDTSDEDTEPAENEDSDLEDFTEDEFVDDTDDEGTDSAESEEDETPADPVDDAEGGDGTTDYTQMTDDDASEDDEEPADGDDTVNDNEGEDDNKSTNVGNKLSDMEKNLFADLTPQQLAIKNNELLQNYITLYDTIGEIFDNINKIPKTYTNTRPLTFIADQLVELKDMVNYIITTTYITRTYVENMTYYKQSLVILTQLNTMLQELNKKDAKK